MSQETSAVPIYHLVPVQPKVHDSAVKLHGDLKGAKLEIIDTDGVDSYVVRVADDPGAQLYGAKRAELCKWVESNSR